MFVVWTVRVGGRGVVFAEEVMSEMHVLGLYFNNCLSIVRLLGWD